MARKEGQSSAEHIITPRHWSVLPRREPTCRPPATSVCRRPDACVNARSCPSAPLGGRRLTARTPPFSSSRSGLLLPLRDETHRNRPTTGRESLLPAGGGPGHFVGAAGEPLPLTNAPGPPLRAGRQRAQDAGRDHKQPRGVVVVVDAEALIGDHKVPVELGDIVLGQLSGRQCGRVDVARAGRIEEAGHPVDEGLYLSLGLVLQPNDGIAGVAVLAECSTCARYQLVGVPSGRLFMGIGA
jgi:hypothetical protein